MTDKRIILPGEEATNRHQNEIWDREDKRDTFWTLVIAVGLPLAFIVIKLILVFKAM